MIRLLWTILYAFLLVLAMLPPFRRVLNENEFDESDVGGRAAKAAEEAEIDREPRIRNCQEELKAAPANGKKQATPTYAAELPKARDGGQRSRTIM